MVNQQWKRLIIHLISVYLLPVTSVAKQVFCFFSILVWLSGSQSISQSVTGLFYRFRFLITKPPIELISDIFLGCRFSGVRRFSVLQYIKTMREWKSSLLVSKSPLCPILGGGENRLMICLDIVKYIFKMSYLKKDIIKFLLQWKPLNMSNLTVTQFCENVFN